MKIRNVLRLWEDKINWWDKLMLDWFGYTTSHLRNLSRQLNRDKATIEAITYRLKDLTPGPEPDFMPSTRIKRYIWQKFRVYCYHSELQESDERAIFSFIDWVFDDNK